MTQIKNFTPHNITITDSDGNVLKVIEPSGLARLSVKTVPAGEIDGVPISKTVFGEPEGLPEYQKGVYYIVSQLVKTALPERKDLFVPAEVLRDEKGNIVGCKSLGL